MVTSVEPVKTAIVEEICSRLETSIRDRTKDNRHSCPTDEMALLLQIGTWSGDPSLNLERSLLLPGLRGIS